MTDSHSPALAPVAELQHVRFSYDRGATWALDDVSLTIHAGERMCLVGPNGSGKSTLARLIAGLTAPDDGRIVLLGHTVYAPQSGPDADAYRAARRGIGMVFQNPEDQIVTTVVEDDVAFGPENLGIARERIGDRITQTLDAVGLASHRDADPTRMSGGQQQRAAIAGMLAMNPSMLVLDEPTAMLDETARAEVMRVLDVLQSRGTTIVHVTHHPDETRHADRVVHMAAGRIIADAPGNEAADCPEPSALSDTISTAIDTTATGSGVNVITAPLPLLGASAEVATNAANGTSATVTADTSTDIRGVVPAGTTITSSSAMAGVVSGAAASPAGTSVAAPAGTSVEAPASSSPAPIIRVSHLSYRYAGDQPPVIDDLSFTITKGETVALMGSNGSGKSTLARLLCALAKPSAGSITVAGIPVAWDKRAPIVGNDSTVQRLKSANRKQLAQLRRRVGYVMQHPEHQLFADTVAEDVAYGPRNQGLSESEVGERVREALSLLHIEHLADRSPFDLSGGQQRLAAIAGVVACRPDVLVMDEPTASLDVHAKARIHELLHTLKARGVTMLIITHDRAEAEELGDRVVRMPIASHAGQTGRGTPADMPKTNGANASARTTSARTTSGETSRSDDTPESAHNMGHDTAPDTPRESVHESHAPTEPAVPDRRRSPIHRLDPRVKMVGFLAAMFTMFAVNTPVQLALGITLTLAVMLFARLNPIRVLASIHPILALLILMSLCNLIVVRTGTPLVAWGPFSITDQGVTIAVLYACRFALVIILGAVFLATTTPTAMTDAFEALLQPFARFGLHAQEIALVMSLALRFIPTLTDETRSIVDAQAARGGSIETGSLTQRIKAMSAIIVPVFAGTLRHADNLSLALDARCYEEGIARTHWRVFAPGPKDAVFAVAVIGYIAAIVAL
ncbi:energy-coupling factor transporter ATPase [Bifidobacterium myosotis]|uniref:ATP-binding cassette domain-containing protein n=1 Tax=Bifidobacterium myosotis TaxID=1630166 RepID=A0A5M9ZNP6_9BIFI|nr:energy-coupling factor transporter ATPase [Bifidobacterium myosotis]KAA8829108.1 ATP-binding cassette domain-containing protein [Bifidobacterium myosotis]